MTGTQHACWVVVAFSLAGCHSDPFPDRNVFDLGKAEFSGRKVSFQKLSSTSGFKVLLQDRSGATLDATFFRYIPYRFDTSDVNHDGETDLVVGLIKATRFDSLLRKRLFILRIDENQIRPLWLGSKVCQNLVDFRSLPGGHIQTLESTSTGDFSVGIYVWQGFGLTLQNYVLNDVSYAQAFQRFNY